jgi:hypothetical protein
VPQQLYQQQWQAQQQPQQQLQQQYQQQPQQQFSLPQLTGLKLPLNKVRTATKFDGKEFFQWSWEFELKAGSAGIWELFSGAATYPYHGTPQQQQAYSEASRTAFQVLSDNLTTKEQLGIREFYGGVAPAAEAWRYM